DHFKLLVSTKELKPFYFTQPGIRAPKTRDSMLLPNKTRIIDDWTAKTISVTIVKPIKRVEMVHASTGYQDDFMGSHLAVQLPQLATKWENSPASVEGKADNMLHYLNYSLLQNKERRLPFYTATNIQGKAFKKVKRKDLFGSYDKWVKDPRIPDSEQWGPELYKSVKHSFDRGHMTKREDVQWGTSEEDARLAAMATFYYTNSVPQRKEVNQDVWRDIEDYILHDQTIAKDLKINVFTGPVLKEDDPLFINQIGGEHPQIPTLFWKIVYFSKKDQKLYRVAFLAGQKHLLDENDLVARREATEEEELFADFELSNTFQVNVGLIEKLTGLSFTPAIEPFQDERPVGLTLEEIEVRDPDFEGRIVMIKGIQL
ncbi:MAG: DNA/RNA non-specific endonuclease, partial [Bacteroidota bacterium]